MYDTKLFNGIGYLPGSVSLWAGERITVIIDFFLLFTPFLGRVAHSLESASI